MNDAMLQRMVAMGCLTIGGWVATAWADTTVAELRQRVYRHALAGDDQAAAITGATVPFADASSA